MERVATVATFDFLAIVAAVATVQINIERAYVCMKSFHCLLHFYAVLKSKNIAANDDSNGSHFWVLCNVKSKTQHRQYLHEYLMR